jgi:hypothetical protein
MASIIKIKRSTGSASPAALGAGELAYSWDQSGGYVNGKLYVGTGSETAGAAANIEVIGGKYFTDMLDHTKGVLTASSAITTDANNKIDYLKVDNLEFDGNTIGTTQVNGDLLLTPNGTGKTVLTNPYIGSTSVSLDEYVQDLLGASIAGGQSITSTYNDTTGVTTLAATVATSSVLGVASFGGDFAVSTGAVSLSTSVNANTGSFGSATAIPVITVNNKGLITAVSTASVASTLTVKADSATTEGIALLTETLEILGGEGIDTVVGTNSITISGEDATSVNKGIASFDSTNFTVTSGAVTSKAVTLGTSSLTLGGTTTAIAGLTQVDINNIRVTGNTISSTNSNGNIVLDPNGTGTIDASNARITNVAEPSSDSDAATKYYVDAARSGLDVKQSVRAATTAAITLSNTQTVDGVALSVGDRVLVKDQADATTNGLYSVSSGSWTRTSDADNTPSGEVTAGMFVFVTEGTNNSDSGWVLTTNDPITLGSSSLNFTQFSGTGTLIAGAGLSKTGFTVDVNVGGGIEIVSDTVQIASSAAGAGLTLATGVLAVGGTANRITVGADAVDIAATYVGQTSITTLGTVATGTWQGTTVAVGYGGTGLATVTSRGIVYGNGTSALGVTSASGTDGSFLRGDATGNPYWSNVFDGGTY